MSPPTSNVVGNLLTATGCWGPYRDDAHLDATVPNWPFTVEGGGTAG